MKLGCICGCLNRSVDARRMDRQRGYGGWISFEYEAAEAEATGISRALGYLRRLLDAPRSD